MHIMDCIPPTLWVFSILTHAIYMVRVKKQNTSTLLHVSVAILKRLHTTPKVNFHFHWHWKIISKLALQEKNTVILV